MKIQHNVCYPFDLNIQIENKTDLLTLLALFNQSPETISKLAAQIPLNTEHKLKPQQIDQNTLCNIYTFLKNKLEHD